MIEVAPHLFVGNALDYERNVKNKDGGWSVVHAAKEPWHRQALGYTGMGCPRDHKEYLFAYRSGDDRVGFNRLCLNMVDAPKPEFFHDEMIDEAMIFIVSSLDLGNNVLIHCNQGGSRAPSLALHFLIRSGIFESFRGLPFEQVEEHFRNIYPAYEPAAGIRGYVERKWNEGHHDQPTIRQDRAAVTRA